MNKFAFAIPFGAVLAGMACDPKTVANYIHRTFPYKVAGLVLLTLSSTIGMEQSRALADATTLTYTGHAFDVPECQNTTLPCTQVNGNVTATVTVSDLAPNFTGLISLSPGNSIISAGGYTQPVNEGGYIIFSNGSITQWYALSLESSNNTVVEIFSANVLPSEHEDFLSVDDRTTSAQALGATTTPGVWSTGPNSPPPSPQCLKDLNGAVHFYQDDFNLTDLKPTSQNAYFRPGVGLLQARLDCGVDKFDWQQLVTHQDDPSSMSARNIGGAFCASLPSPLQLKINCSAALGVPVKLSSITTPYSDPPQGGGYTNEETTDNSYPFYYDNNNNNSDSRRNVINHTIDGSELQFFDQPYDPCLPGGEYANTEICNGTQQQANSYGGFKTRLVGVNSDGTLRDLGQNFTEWNSNYNGNGTGGIGSKVTDVLATPISGSGGVTITSINGVLVTSLPSGGSCDGAFEGMVNGSVSVSANQNCTFTNGCEITGDVTVNGGSLDLECVVDGNLTANGGNLYLGPVAVVKGNIQVYQSSVLTADSSTINGNLTIQSLTGNTQNTVCGAQIGRNLQAQSNASPLEIGGTTSNGCAGNSIGGNLLVQNNTAAVQVDNNTVDGNLLIDANTATTDVSSNSVGKNMECENNATVTYLAVNTVKGNNQGQCAASP